MMRMIAAKINSDMATTEKVSWQRDCHSALQPVYLG
jgi:hypothetical protein